MEGSPASEPDPRHRCRRDTASKTKNKYSVWKPFHQPFFTRVDIDVDVDVGFGSRWTLNVYRLVVYVRVCHPTAGVCIMNSRQR